MKDRVVVGTDWNKMIYGYLVVVGAGWRKMIYGYLVVVGAGWRKMIYEGSCCGWNGLE